MNEKTKAKVEEFLGHEADWHLGMAARLMVDPPASTPELHQLRNQTIQNHIQFAVLKQLAELQDTLNNIMLEVRR